MKDYKLNGFQKFLIYFGIIIGVLVAIVIICFAILYFSPGTPVLGFEYVLRDKVNEKVLTADYITDIQSFEINTGITDIYIYPLDLTVEEDIEPNSIKLVHKEGLSGFAKSINADLEFTQDIKLKSFEEDTTEYKTLSITIDEPTGWISKNGASIFIYIPENIQLNTISAKSKSGNIYYSSFFKTNNTSSSSNNNNEKPSMLKCSNLYLKTGGFGKVNIKNDQEILNYYLTTELSSLNFEGSTNINANTIKFETKAGTFSFTNEEANATISLLNELFIKSDNGSGPYIVLNNLDANLRVEVDKGYFKIDQIGSLSNYKTVAMTTNNSNINFGKVYAYVSILGKNDDTSNSINIDTLNYPAQTNTLEAGSSDININNLEGSTAFNTSSGNINVGLVSVTSNISAYTTSGNVNINYVSSEVGNTSVKTTIFTKTGSIDLNNISCFLKIFVLENSSQSKLNLVFNAVATDDNIIEAKDRNIDIVLKGIKDYLQHRIVSTNQIDISKGATDGVAEGGKIEEIDYDNLLEDEKYKNFSYNYRLGYTKDSNTYNKHSYDSWGKLLISTSGRTYVTAFAGNV